MGETILLILFGWILGIFSPLILDEVRKRRNRVEFETAIRTELNELRLKLVSAIFVTKLWLGTFDRPLLDWMRPLVRTYKGAYPTEQIVQGVEVMSNLTDEQLSAYLASEYSKRLTALEVKRYTTPYLESKMDQLSLFPEKVQAQILVIKARLEMVNAEVDRSFFYFDKTFDSTLNDNNRSIVDQNLAGRYEAIAIQARITVELINAVDAL